MQTNFLESDDKLFSLGMSQFKSSFVTYKDIKAVDGLDFPENLATMFVAN